MEGSTVTFSISLTIGVRMKNSTDLSSGPGPHHNALGRLMRTPFLRAAAVAVCRRRRPPHGPPPPSRAIAGSTSTCDTCLSHPCFHVCHTDPIDTWKTSNPALLDREGLFLLWYIRLLHLLGFRPRATKAKCSPHILVVGHHEHRACSREWSAGSMGSLATTCNHLQPPATICNHMQPLQPTATKRFM